MFKYPICKKFNRRSTILWDLKPTESFGGTVTRNLQELGWWNYFLALRASYTVRGYSVYYTSVKSLLFTFEKNGWVVYNPTSSPPCNNNNNSGQNIFIKTNCWKISKNKQMQVEISAVTLTERRHLASFPALLPSRGDKKQRNPSGCQGGEAGTTSQGCKSSRGANPRKGNQRGSQI